MRSRLAQRGFRTLPSVLIALAVVAGAAPSRTLAGCAHYVVSANTSTQSLNQLEILDQGTALHAVALKSQLPARPRPCSGALCSGKPAVPVPPPGVAGSLRVEQWGDLLAPRPLEPGPARALAHREGIVHPLVEGSSIERPPRFSPILAV
jgi:hypothetical protein